MSLPPLNDVLNSPPSPDSPLAQALSTLFEPSPVLLEELVPKLSERLNESNSSLRPTVESYVDLIDATLVTISKWSYSVKADFVGGHPRIGEMKNLSTLSKLEQAAKATPPEVLARLGYLNAHYERRYPGLIYITFVNGRSRTEIAQEMEGRLGLRSEDAPTIDSVQPLTVEDSRWKHEVERAVDDVGKIAKKRLQSL